MRIEITTELEGSELRSAVRKLIYGGRGDDTTRARSPVHRDMLPVDGDHAHRELVAAAADREGQVNGLRK